MPGYTPEQRAQYAEQVCELVREWIVRRESEFAVRIQRGVEWCPDALSGDRTPRPNPTLTLTVTINGGARDTDGPPIVSAPPVFRGPPGPASPGPDAPDG